MKKLNLANMPDTQVLTREQLKKVMGGQNGSGSGSTKFLCTCDNGFSFALGVYETWQIIDAINKQCSGGGGRCEAA